MRSGVYKDIERRASAKASNLDLDRQLQNIEMLNQQIKLEESLTQFKKWITYYIFPNNYLYNYNFNFNKIESYSFFLIKLAKIKKVL